MKSAINVVVLGTGAVGKSCLSIRYIQNSFEKDYEPTIQNTYSKVITLDRKTYQLDILDTAGMESGDVFKPKMFREANTFILVYDITERSSFDALETIHEDILRIRGSDPAPTAVFANKVDLAEDRIISTEEGQKFAKSINAVYFETSAKTAVGVNEGFEGAVREYLKTQTQKKKSLCLLI